MHYAMFSRSWVQHFNMRCSSEGGFRCRKNISICHVLPKVILGAGSTNIGTGRKACRKRDAVDIFCFRRCSPEGAFRQWENIPRRTNIRTGRKACRKRDAVDLFGSRRCSPEGAFRQWENIPRRTNIRTGRKACRKRDAVGIFGFRRCSPDGAFRQWENIPRRTNIRTGRKACRKRDSVSRTVTKSTFQNEPKMS